MTAGSNSKHSPLAPVLSELSRIADAVESNRAAADRRTIDTLQQEVTQLRAVVAHLRAAQGPLPEALRPVVARAMLDIPVPDMLIDGKIPQPRAHAEHTADTSDS